MNHSLKDSLNHMKYMIRFHMIILNNMKSLHKMGKNCMMDTYLKMLLTHQKMLLTHYYLMDTYQRMLLTHQRMLLAMRLSY